MTTHFGVQVVLFLVLVSLLATPVGLQAQSGPQWIGVKGPQEAKLRAAVFRPSGDGPFPVVVVLPGSGGLMDGHFAWGPDLASAGFVTVVGCYFKGSETIRMGDQAVNPCPQAPNFDDARRVENVVALMDAGRRVLGARRDRVALVGFSAGGRVAVVAASSGADVQAVVSVSGRVGGIPNSVVQNLRAPLLILQSKDDGDVPVEKTREFEERAHALGKNVEAYYYEAGGHSLKLLSSHREDFTRRVVEFLNKYLRP